MPSLDEILKDTLIQIGRLSNPGGFTEFEPGISTLAHRPTPDLNLGPAPQPVWVWDYTGVRQVNEAMPMNRVEELEVWSRTIADMHGTDMGWMTVASPVDWGPINVTFPSIPENLTLPLTQKYFVKGFMLSSGTNTGSNEWWPLPATFDQSFASVFVYDLTSRQQLQPPAKVDAARYNDATFMPAPNVESGDLPIGSTGDTEDRHFICVVLSLVCMQERADFDPAGLEGMGRFYPHFMIMSNKGFSGRNRITATITVTRPDRAGYHGTFMNPGGAPRILNHPDMDPAILPMYATDSNARRGVDPANLLVLPYWDLIFEYFLPLDYRGGNLNPNLLLRNQPTKVVDRSLAGTRTVSKVLQHLDYSRILNLVSAAIANPLLVPLIPAPFRPLGVLATKAVLSRPSLQTVMFGNLLSLLQIGDAKKGTFLPRIGTDLTKLPRQGTFDNIHLSPRMKAHQVIGTTQMADPNWQSSLDTLDTIRMAPICEHDCMHTHWRWGAAFKGLGANQKPISGFSDDPDPRFTGTGKPYKEVANPMVPLNQNLEIALGSNQQLVYSAEIVDIAPGVWQPVYHHGSAYVLGYSAPGAAALVGARAMIGNSPEDSELYWNIRYQATVEGHLDRVLLNSFDLSRAMYAANTVRLHTKVFEEPANVSIEAMLANAKALLALHHIELIEVSRETFTNSDEIFKFETLVVDQSVPTDDQTELFNFRGEAEPDDLLIYFVRTLVPTQAGCAAHPPDKPGAIVSASFANEWTLAHQIGHLLGLDHVDDINRLMTSRSTSTIEAAVPEIVESEVVTMLDSPLIQV